MENEDVLGRDINFAWQQAIYWPLKEFLQGFVTCKECGTLFTEDIEFNVPILTGRGCQFDTSRTGKRVPHFGKRFTAGGKKTLFLFPCHLLGRLGKMSRYLYMHVRIHIRFEMQRSIVHRVRRVLRLMCIKEPFRNSFSVRKWHFTRWNLYNSNLRLHFGRTIYKDLARVCIYWSIFIPNVHHIFTTIHVLQVNSKQSILLKCTICTCNT